MSTICRASCKLSEKTGEQLTVDHKLLGGKWLILANGSQQDCLLLINTWCAVEVIYGCIYIYIALVIAPNKLG